MRRQNPKNMSDVFGQFFTFWR